MPSAFIVNAVLPGLRLREVCYLAFFNPFQSVYHDQTLVPFISPPRIDRIKRFRTSMIQPSYSREDPSLPITSCNRVRLENGKGKGKAVLPPNGKHSPAIATIQSDSDEEGEESDNEQEEDGEMEIDELDELTPVVQSPAPGVGQVKVNGVHSQLQSRPAPHPNNKGVNGIRNGVGVELADVATVPFIPQAAAPGAR